tara:strand:- start:3032 stop:3766 length:735 start_codon:yes stop_codon:yes gene_type:complete
MNKKCELIYEGKAKKIFASDDPKKVIIEFKDDATAFNASKKAQFKGKGELNCMISTRIFEYLDKHNITTHFIEKIDDISIIAHKVKIIPIEVVLRNIAYGSICKQTTIQPRTKFEIPIIDLYLKNDELNDPLLTTDRILLMNLIKTSEMKVIKDLTLRINDILKNFFLTIDLELVDFKLEFGFNHNGDILLADEFSPDNCRLWDLKAKDVKIKSLDKDRFRNDLGDLLEAYSEINTRINNFIGS